MHAKGLASGHLAGIKVVDLTRGMQGGDGSMLLVDYGADGLKLQNPSRNLLESSAAFCVWNRGKKSVAVGLSETEDLRASPELARDADVFLESFRPGVAERLGVSNSAIKDANPCIIYCVLRHIRLWQQWPMGASARL